jgi:hypothetical protein
MKHSMAFVVMIAVVVLAAVISGCTSSTSPPAVPAQNTPVAIATPVMTPVAALTLPPTAVPGTDTTVADKNFVNGMEACYASIPVISNISTHIALVNCVQGVPDPKGQCAQNYQSNVRRYLKDDDTTAGYNRQNTRISLARDAYNQNLSYNYVTGQDEACSQPPLAVPI